MTAPEAGHPRAEQPQEGGGEELIRPVFVERCTKNCPGPRTPSRTKCRTCLAGGPSGDNGGTASPPKASFLPPRRRRHRRRISSRRAPTVPPSKEGALPGAARYHLIISSPAPKKRFRRRARARIATGAGPGPKEPAS